MQAMEESENWLKVMTAPTLESLGITADKIASYDTRIPRYTSYPTAPFWTEEFNHESWRDHLAARSAGNYPLSLYVHLPFCEKHCLFCACNVIITPKKQIAEEYLGYLGREMDLVARYYTGSGEACQLHLGGGTPNYLSIAQMSRLVKMLESHFPFSADKSERSIEVDPRIATPDDIQRYHDLHGFRRISFGVQDFHEETQFAIGRKQTRDITFANVATARAKGFHSVNIDLIYGLPRQTEESWRETLDSVCELRPDRLALYNFAFLPTKLAHQRALLQENLPPPEMKLQMFIEAHNRLTREGWAFIGMDHYSLEEDSLTVAHREGRLRRNFMGYSTLRGTDMLAFGTSAISEFKGAFSQNEKKLSTYKRMLEEGHLPVERGLVLSEDDLVRQHIITELMCNGVLRYDAPTPVPGVDLRALVNDERARLEPLAEDNLIELSDDRLLVTEKGRVFLRNIAVVFDAHLNQAREKPLFSRAV